MIFHRFLRIFFSENSLGVLQRKAMRKQMISGENNHDFVVCYHKKESTILGLDHYNGCPEFKR